ncbi:putative copper resistance protein D [Undibacterium sp. GrIS 1.2]|uniref:copper resistance D family protein n=1 Tax=Undibacterium sp. GrIS 1.2 TaxID=3143933 RepID=UPI003394FFCB
MAEIGAIQHLATWALNLAFAIMLGALASQVWLSSGLSWGGNRKSLAGLTRQPSSWALTAASRLQRILTISTIITLIASTGVLWIEAAVMAELPLLASWDAGIALATSTHFGHAYLVGASALVMVVFINIFLSKLTTSHQHLRTQQIILAICIGVFAYSRSVVSHAVISGDFTWSVMIDWVHLLLVSLWVGEVLIAGLSVLAKPVGSLQDHRRDCISYVTVLSHSASWGLVGIFITGGLNVWRGLGDVNSVSAITDSAYGITLLLKIALVIGAAALGGYNRFYVMPDLLLALAAPDHAHAGATRRFILVLRIEAFALLLVMFVAAVLSASSPLSAA